MEAIKYRHYRNPRENKDQTIAYTFINGVKYSGVGDDDKDALQNLLQVVQLHELSPESMITIPTMMPTMNENESMLKSAAFIAFLLVMILSAMALIIFILNVI